MISYKTDQLPPRFLSPATVHGSRPTLQVAGGFALILAVMLSIQFAGPAILDNDGYYHIRWSRMLAEHAPKLPPFKPLPLTTLNERDYVDHHYLYHVLLIPFTAGDLRVGAKLSAAIFSSLAVAALFWLMAAYRLPYRWAWLIPLLLSSEPFLYRMSMARAPSLSLAFLGVGIYLILKRRWVWLSLLSFAFVWLYSLFPLIFAVALAYTAAVYLAERRLEPGAALATFSGIVAGLLINPYFPKNLVLFWDHLMMKLTADYSVNVGVEWYPYDTWVMLGGSAVAFVIYFAGLVAFDFRRQGRDPKPLFFLILATMFLLMAFKSRRFIEYWPPFAVLFGAFTLSPYIERLMKRGVRHRTDRAVCAVAASVAMVALLGTMTVTVLVAHLNIRTETDPYAYRGASLWLAENTPPGTVVFNTDWDDFPMLFYYNPDRTYIVGLDPTYLYDRNPEMWNLYKDITLGDKSDPAPIIKERFGAEYVFTDNYHEDFLRVARETGDFETVYTDRYTTVLRIIR